MRSGAPSTLALALVVACVGSDPDPLGDDDDTKPGATSSSSSSSSSSSGGSSGATGAAMLSLGTTDLDFGSVPKDTDGSPLTLSVRNTGGAALNVAATLAGANVTAFKVASNGCMNAVAAGESCAFTILFHPSVVGDLAATLDVDGGPAGKQTVTLHGKGTPAPLLTPTTATFADTANLAPATGSQTFTFKPETADEVSKVTLSNDKDFTLVVDTCTGKAVPGGGSCAIHVAFAPTQGKGDRSTTLDLTTKSGLMARSTLHGLSTGAATLLLTPDILDFGDAPDGFDSDQVVTIKNTGNVATTHKPELASVDPKLKVTFSSCTDPLAPGGSCTATVRLNTTTTGSFSSVVNLDAGDGTQPVSAKAIIKAHPRLQFVLVSPQEYGAVGFQHERAWELKVTNKGELKTAVLSRTFEALPTNSWGIIDNCTGSTLAAGQSCTLDLTLGPNTPAPSAASLNVHFSAPGTTDGDLTVLAAAGFLCPSGNTAAGDTECSTGGFSNQWCSAFFGCSAGYLLNGETCERNNQCLSKSCPVATHVCN